MHGNVAIFNSYGVATVNQYIKIPIPLLVSMLLMISVPAWSSGPADDEVTSAQRNVVKEVRYFHTEAEKGNAEAEIATAEAMIEAAAV